MYTDFFGLKEMPFAVTPDPRFSYPSRGSQEAQGFIQFAADYKEGLAVLTGRVGCGKTTVGNLLVRKWEKDPTKAVAYLPSANDRGKAAFLKRIMLGFGIDSKARNYASNQKVFESFLIRSHDEGKHVVLVIDEGQDIYTDNIDTIVDLTNFRTATEQLITVIILAQDNFATKLIRKGAFKSRIAQNVILNPLSPEDTARMIAHRLRVAGGTVGGDNLSPYLTEDALVEIYRITRGVPRDVCMFCNALFLTAFLESEKPIGAALCLRVLEEKGKLKDWPVKE
jgi:general secretion pathway protein A